MWEKRFESYQMVLERLSEAVAEHRRSPDNKVIQAGVIQNFEFTVELAWKVMKDYLEEQNFVLNTPREVAKQAFASNIIENGDSWMSALNDRNRTSHLYDKHLAEEIVGRVCDLYMGCFLGLVTYLKGKI